MPILFVSLLIAFACTSLWASTSAPIQIILDPGHGGSDQGAVYFGVKESKINLKVALLLNELLISDKRFSPHLTRNKDVSLSLEERAEIANLKKGDIFLSLHANAYEKDSTKGVEIYFQNQLPPDEEVLFLASKENENTKKHNYLNWPLGFVNDAKGLNSEVTSILQDLQLNSRIRYSSQLAESLGEHWQVSKRSERHLIKQAPFHVISNVSMPANLIEMGYLTNKSEAKNLKSKTYQKKIANSLYLGLINYKDYIDKSPLNDLD
ncbi:MAG: N-acetylmuramoyl-L-alanine amidase [Bdellovibrionaceae bacterium]|nr:N-acetylmuramoyl-L-alanine amidase [Pseudobdellovibrionaceae bacterium]